MKYRPVGGQKINAEGCRNRDSPRTVWLRRTSGAVLSIWARSSPHTCFLGWTPAGRRRALEMNETDWSETDIDLKRHWCILNQYSLVFNTERLYFQNAFMFEKDYSSSQSKGIWKRFSKPRPVCGSLTSEHLPSANLLQPWQQACCVWNVPHETCCLNGAYCLVKIRRT